MLSETLSEGIVSDAKHSSRPDNDTAEKSNLQEKAQQSEFSSETVSYDLLKMEERQIEDQTFQADINPFGEVMFGSYRQDTELEPLGDATFLFYKDGKVISALEGMTEDNIRTDKSFQKVEAVSFPDYNSDGYQDIILSALAEKTIQSVLGFMGVQKSSTTGMDSWKQLYIDFLQIQDTEAWDGVTLIWLDDDEIPELADTGRTEAAGCRIINYDDGELFVTQLDRLNFTYIWEGKPSLQLRWIYGFLLWSGVQPGVQENATDCRGMLRGWR